MKNQDIAQPNINSSEFYDLFYDLPVKIGDLLRTMQFRGWIYNEKTIRPCVESLLRLSLNDLNAVHQDLIDKIEEKRNEDHKHSIIKNMILTSHRYNVSIDLPPAFK